MDHHSGEVPDLLSCGQLLSGSESDGSCFYYAIVGGEYGCGLVPSVFQEN